MSLTGNRWPLAGVMAGALCLALTAAPALANPQDDEDDSGSKSRQEVRVYSDNDDDDAGNRNEVRIYNDNDDDDAAPGVRKEIRVYHDGDGEEAKVSGGYLGVRVQDVTRELQKAKDLPNTNGALIARVESGSPAAKAGIQRGDVIVEVDKHTIGESSELIRRMGNMEPGAKVPVVVLRNGMRKTFTVTLGKRPREFTMVVPPRAPRGPREPLAPYWVERGDMPQMPEIGEQLDRIRVYRQDLQRQLSDIQDQLTRLREGDLQRLEDEIRSLRDELRARDDEQHRSHSD